MADPTTIPIKDIQRLVSRGEKQGYLTAEDIFAVIAPDLVEQLDELVGQLQRINVIIVDSAEAGARMMKERRGRMPGEATASDALSSYLREISQLPSLDREAEIHYANEYRSGIRRAMRAVVEARLFVDHVLGAVSRIRQDKGSVWDVVDRIRYTQDDDPESAREALVAVGVELSRLQQREHRILRQIHRRGVGPERAQSLSQELQEIRSELAERLAGVPFEPKFMKEIATQMIAIHGRLESELRERKVLAEQLGVEEAALDRALKAARRDPEAADPTAEAVAEVDRRYRNLRRRVRRIEKQAGMGFDALHSAVRQYRGGILRAQRARDALILSAQRLVLSSARYYGRRLGGSGMEVADLISAGNLGLMRAVELFDPDRGNRFSTFAGHWVRHAMIRTIHTQSRTVYVPPHIRQQMSKILAMENELIQKLGRSPTDDELARAADLDIPKLRHTVQSFGRMSSIDRPLDPGDSGSATYGDILADDRATPDEALEGAERREMVRKLAERLQGRERTIVFMRMGWDNEEPKTLAEIGELFGISRQRVEQLEKRALSKLRRWAQATGLGDPIFS